MTTSKASQLIVISGVFFIFAALLAGNWYDWEPARFGIRLQSGQRYQSPMFHVDLNTTYLIELDAERDIPVEKINCLLLTWQYDIERDIPNFDLYNTAISS